MFGGRFAGPFGGAVCLYATAARPKIQTMKPSTRDRANQGKLVIRCGVENSTMLERNAMITMKCSQRLSYRRAVRLDNWRC